MKREPIGKKLRFEIFKRDEFACQYCGAHPPAVVLEIDHITPVADGGRSLIDNLVTACRPCNAGKGARPLTSVPISLHEKAQEIEEREEQLRGYSAIMQAKENRIIDEVLLICEFFWDKDKRMPDDWFNGIRRFIETLGYWEVKAAAEAGTARFVHNKKRAFLYCAKICWNKIRGVKEPNAE